MRKIKFRGLRHLDNGKTEWVYGFYVERWNNKRCICQYNPKEIPSKPNEYEDNWDIFVDVYEDSVGQFTGLKDRAGVDVYEGDLLKDSEFTYVVYWCDDIAAFMVEEYKSECDAPKIWLLSDFCNECEIIGNIYDNPIEE